MLHSLCALYVLFAEVPILEMRSTRTYPIAIVVVDRLKILAPVPAHHQQALRHDCIFIEYFAGSGLLSKTLGKSGVNVHPLQDVELDGADFSQEGCLAGERACLCGLAQFGRLVVHMAPPCSTYSRARDRS